MDKKRMLVAGALATGIAISGLLGSVHTAQAWPKRSGANCESVYVAMQNDQGQRYAWNGKIIANGQAVASDSGVADTWEWKEIRWSPPENFSGSVYAVLHMKDDSVSVQEVLQCVGTATSTPVIPTATSIVTPTATSTPVIPTATSIVTPTDTPQPDSSVTPTPGATATEKPREIITYPGADLLVSASCLSTTENQTVSVDIGAWFTSQPAYYDGNRSQIRDEVTEVPNTEILVSVVGGKVEGGMPEGDYKKFEVGSLYKDKIAHVILTVVVTDTQTFELTILVRSPNQSQIGDNVGNNVVYVYLCDPAGKQVSETLRPTGGHSRDVQSHQPNTFVLVLVIGVIFALGFGLTKVPSLVRIASKRYRH